MHDQLIMLVSRLDTLCICKYKSCLVFQYHDCRSLKISFIPEHLLTGLVNGEMKSDCITVFTDYYENTDHTNA